MNERNKGIAMMFLVVAIVTGVGFGVFDAVKVGCTAFVIVLGGGIVVVTMSELLDQRASRALRQKLPVQCRDVGGA